MSKRFKYPTDPAILKKHLNTDKSVFVFNKWEEVVKYDEDGEKKPADPDEWKRYGPGPITHKASQDFADAIHDEIHAGYGFTPFARRGVLRLRGHPYHQPTQPTSSAVSASQWALKMTKSRETDANTGTRAQTVGHLS